MNEEEKRQTKKQARKTIWIQIVVALIVSFIVSLLWGVLSADAAPAETIDENGNGMFKAEYSRLPDDSKAHYNIDLANEPEPEEEGGFLDGLENLNPITATKQAVTEQMNEMMLWMVNLMLSFNMMMVNIMIGILNFSFQTEIVNSLVDGMEGVVQGIAGVTGLNISGGLFGSLIGFAVIASAVALLYQLFIKKSPLASLQGILKTIIALAFAFTLFANFGPLIKGMNEISTNISATIMTGTTNMVSGESKTNEQVRDEVASNLWDSFIGRPYMILQYGTDDIETLGEERVNELLAMPVGADRQEYVDEIEAGERGNESMLLGNTVDRVAFAGMFSFINALVSIPIFLLALAMLIFQVWFLLIAFISPFILIQAAFPGQFGVLKRYSVELMYPLVCKIIVTVAAQFVFTIGFLVYEIPALPSVGIPQYYVAAAFQLVIFSAIFFLRKRIAAIMASGNRGPFESLRTDINGLKHSVDGATSLLGNLGKTAVSVTAAAVTGGSSAAVTAAAAGAAKTLTDQNQAVEEEAPVKSDHSQPIANVEEEREEVKAEEAAPDSKPIATVSKEAEVEPEPENGQPVQTQTEPMATVQKEEVPESVQPETAPIAAAEEPAAFEPVSMEPETNETNETNETLQSAPVQPVAMESESVEPAPVDEPSYESERPAEPSLMSTVQAEAPVETQPAVETEEAPPVTEPANNLSQPLTTIEEMDEDEGNVELRVKNQNATESGDEHV